MSGRWTLQNEQVLRIRSLDRWADAAGNSEYRTSFAVCETLPLDCRTQSWWRLAAEQCMYKEPRDAYTAATGAFCGQRTRLMLKGNTVARLILCNVSVMALQTEHTIELRACHWFWQMSLHPNQTQPLGKTHCKPSCSWPEQ